MRFHSGTKQMGGTDSESDDVDVTLSHTKEDPSGITDPSDDPVVSEDGGEAGVLLGKRMGIHKNRKRRRVSAMKSESDDVEDIIMILYNIEDSIHLSHKSTESSLSIMGLLIIFMLTVIISLNFAFVNVRTSV
jgi:hypothetical protein